MRFCAGHELKALHIGTRMLGVLVRLGVIGSLSDHAGSLLKLAFAFDRFGSGQSGFHMFMSGLGHDGNPLEQRFWIVARSGHGPYIPCMPAILLARRLARDRAIQPGAKPCVDLIDLDSYLGALAGLDIEIIRDDIDA